MSTHIRARHRGVVLPVMGAQGLVHPPEKNDSKKGQREQRVVSCNRKVDQGTALTCRKQQALARSRPYCSNEEDGIAVKTYHGVVGLVHFGCCMENTLDKRQLGLQLLQELALLLPPARCILTVLGQPPSLLFPLRAWWQHLVIRILVATIFSAVAA